MKIGLASLGAVALLVSACGTGSNEPTTGEAERQCEKFLEDRLKAPATADFELTTTGGPVSFTSTGYVDSENGFGAKVRADASCEISLSGDTWHLDDWTLTQR